MRNLRGLQSTQKLQPFASRTISGRGPHLVRGLHTPGLRECAAKQARSQKFAMRGLFWGFGGKTPSRRRHGGLGAEPPALENLTFFCKNY